VFDAIVASEDTTFWTNKGIDFKGIMRAAWNNFTGGEQQGASTITQQYARMTYDLGQNSSYMRKLNEAVLAWRLGNELDKKQILEYYLNVVPFGRQTIGIEAAARAYFNKTADKRADPKTQITVSEAMALVAMVKQPYPLPGEPGYDPTYSAEAKAQAIGRWGYVRDAMVTKTHTLTQADADKLTFPETFIKDDGNQKAGYGRTEPVGLVVNHVYDELMHTKGSPYFGWTAKAIDEAGLDIITTINKPAQDIAEKTINPNVDGSVMKGLNPKLQAAMVAVEPGTGRVLAYYGGQDGKGADYAGIFQDEKGEWGGFGAHSPGSSFKVYTLAAALKSGISLNSYWQWGPHDLPGREGTNQVRNASHCDIVPPVPPAKYQSEDYPCTLLNATTNSLNVPFYEVTMSVTPAKVLEMAKAAGIDWMWTDAHKRVHLPDENMADMQGNFDTILGIGQYAVTVVDHANGMATMAAGGLRATAHFVQSVKQAGKVTFSEKLPTNTQKIFSATVSNDLDYALSTVGGAKTLAGQMSGWGVAAKTGSWQLGNSNSDNAHVWTAGFTKKIGVAVWVGSGAPEEFALKKADNKTTMWGADQPMQIFQRFTKEATAALGWKSAGMKFGPQSNSGDMNPPGSVPSPTPTDNNCQGQDNCNPGGGPGGGQGGGPGGVQKPFLNGVGNPVVTQAGDLVLSLTGFNFIQGTTTASVNGKSVTFTYVGPQSGKITISPAPKSAVTLKVTVSNGQGLDAQRSYDYVPGP
jgi:membrane peptidoglycan carboxypeptidase